MIGAEQVALGLGLQLAAEGHRMRGRDGNIDAPAGACHKVLDRAGVVPTDRVR